jgi:hypothetical protein
MLHCIPFLHPSRSVWLRLLLRLDSVFQQAFAATLLHIPCQLGRVACTLVEDWL